MDEIEETPAYIGSDLRIRLSGVQAVDDDGVKTYQNAGTCTYEIKTPAGVVLTDGTTTASGALAYHAASDGDYVLVIDKAVTLLITYLQRCDLFVDFSQGGNDGRFRLRLRGDYQ